MQHLIPWHRHDRDRVLYAAQAAQDREHDEALARLRLAPGARLAEARQWRDDERARQGFAS